MFNVWVDYPSADEELEIVKRTTADIEVKITPTLHAEQIAALTQIVRKVPVADHVARYALGIGPADAAAENRTRPSSSRTMSCGAPGRGPASIWCWAPRPGPCCMGRFFVTTDDIQAVAPPVLRHRLKLNFNADAAGVNADEVIRRLLVHVPAGTESKPASVPDVFKRA